MMFWNDRSKTKTKMLYFKKRPISGRCLPGASGGVNEGYQWGTNDLRSAFGGEPVFYKQLVININISNLSFLYQIIAKRNDDTGRANASK